MAGEQGSEASTGAGLGQSAQACDVEESARQELLRLRASIDNLDAALVHLLAERFKCTQAVGHLKAVHKLPPADRTRENAQITRLRRLAEDAHLDPAFAEKFLNFVIEEVIQNHKEIAQGKQAR
jgi:chorismate mutase